jgi:hypothetical protein
MENTMDCIQLNDPPCFLTHHLLLRPDCLARLTLPTQLSQQDADRISALLDALVVDGEDLTGIDDWPFDCANSLNESDDGSDDSDNSQTVNDIQASEENTLNAVQVGHANINPS